MGRCLCRRHRESTDGYVADGNSVRRSVGVEYSCSLSRCYRFEEYAHGLLERCWTEQGSAAQEIYIVQMRKKDDEVLWALWDESG